jgi:hypothetical protein
MLLGILLILPSQFLKGELRHQITSKIGEILAQKKFCPRGFGVLLLIRLLGYSVEEPYLKQCVLPSSIVEGTPSSL